MTNIDMYMPQGGVQGHAGQGTMIEAARAVEDVRAAIIVARQFPRDVPQALRRIEETFSVPAMAERSFYSYPKGRTNVTGPTIHLAKAVAQLWQNLNTGVKELSRTKGQSEMEAFAQCLETNYRTSTVFIVQHAMDAGKDVKELTDLRSIYENNANMANRRLRAMIESVIPAYVMDLAKERAGQTLRHGGGKPLAVRVDALLKTFEGIGVDVEQVESERGRPAAKWSEIDVAHLTVLGKSIRSGEINLSDAFPARIITVEDMRPSVPMRPTVVPAAAGPAEPAPVADPWAAVEYPEPEDDGGVLTGVDQDGRVRTFRGSSEPGENHLWVEDAPRAEWPVVAQPGGGV